MSRKKNAAKIILVAEGKKLGQLNPQMGRIPKKCLVLKGLKNDCICFFCVARDASRAYVTGDFTDGGLVDDVSELSPSQMLHLNNWLSFYQKTYAAVGKLVGHFYDEDGNPTKALEDALAVIAVGLKLKEERHEENKQFPPCNSEFNSGVSRVWCSKNSGGIQRNWVGVPRKLHIVGYDGYRCVCVRTTGPPSENPDSEEHNDRGDLDNPSLKEYKDCNPLFDWCLLKE
ncbi:hypothetical protein GDO78_000847 [Eleutherodactylus coqui]|uniref:Uncharacterized protein n=1 Tax=Eleutherodactylus coqui TaxID=57060 RepID=A0A8J6FRA7_ELECQ|nr:hypothetical protein GDO78_000847 [Eleutherodactylus coqui]